jgi:hypothetical protein
LKRTIFAVGVTGSPAAALRATADAAAATRIFVLACLMSGPPIAGVWIALS